jgi:hypothetical protein
MKVWPSHFGQSIFDLAIQFYGDLSGLGKIIRSVPDIDNDVPVGTLVTVDEVNEPNVINYAKKNIIPASDVFNPVSDGPGFDYDLDFDFI